MRQPNRRGIAPARLTMFYDGPAASNMIIPSSSAEVSARVLSVRAAAGFSQGGHGLSSTASLADARAGPPSLRIAVRTKSPKNALQIVWVIIYEVEVTRIRLACMI